MASDIHALPVPSPAASFQAAIGQSGVEALDPERLGVGFTALVGPRALATVEHGISVLSKQHEARSVDTPCRDAAIRELLSGTRRAYAARGARGKRAPALVREPLELMLDTCDHTL